MISKQEQSQILLLLQDPKFRTIERIADLLLQRIKDQSPIRDTDFETLREVFIQQGKVEGINALLQELRVQASHA